MLAQVRPLVPRGKNGLFDSVERILLAIHVVSAKSSAMLPNQLPVQSAFLDISSANSRRIPIDA